MKNNTTPRLDLRERDEILLSRDDERAETAGCGQLDSEEREGGCGFC